MTRPSIKTVSCPRCGKPVPWTPESKYRPFCSERCKTNDLGAWATGQYRVPGSPLEETDLPPPEARED
jgi:endogenous inhibitor of DNA gyrase (YacG/DUF329 family)